MRQLRCRIIHISRVEDPEKIENEVTTKLKLGWQLVTVGRADVVRMWVAEAIARRAKR